MLFQSLYFDSLFVELPRAGQAGSAQTPNIALIIILHNLLFLLHKILFIFHIYFFIICHILYNLQTLYMTFYEFNVTVKN